eukprot:354857-Chlamydomonas_euryale.AAC.36
MVGLALCGHPRNLLHTRACPEARTVDGFASVAARTRLHRAPGRNHTTAGQLICLHDIAAAQQPAVSFPFPTPFGESVRPALASVAMAECTPRCRRLETPVPKSRCSPRTGPCLAAKRQVPLLRSSGAGDQ